MCGGTLCYLDRVSLQGRLQLILASHIFDILVFEEPLCEGERFFQFRDFSWKKCNP